jgi:enoyl-CoA hydratase/carnithine racemase
VSPLQVDFSAAVARIGLDDPQRRNALGMEMFDALDGAIAAVRSSEASVLLLHGRGRAFCAGFDLSAAERDPAIVADFIERLGELVMSLRRLPQVVVGAVHGAAIAGGCALVSACDVVVVSATAKLGYPVHRLGLSPAVSAATLMQAIGAGAARALMLGGQLIDGSAARRLGLAGVLVPTDEGVLPEAQALCEAVAGHGPHALRVTKSWLNELDGSHDARRVEGPAGETAAQMRGAEAQATMLAALAKRR